MKTFALAALIAFLTSSFAYADELADKVDPLARPYVESQTVVGMTIGILHQDQTLVRGYGQISAKDTSVPNGQTVYEIGSISKVFTGILLADAMVAGRVSLVTPVDQLLPHGTRMPRREPSQPIRLWHLSTHTSGLPRLPDNLQPANPENPYADYNEERLTQFLAKHQPRKRPGEAMAYSNLGVGLLGNLLARERQVDYETLLRQRITAPLDMADTTIKLQSPQKARLAGPHVAGGSPSGNWDFDSLAGAGGIRSDMDDMLKFAQAQLHPPEGKLGTAIDLAWQIHQQPLNTNDFAKGLGWHVARDGETRWHTGQTGGYHSAIFVNRQQNVAVVILANTATEEIDALAEQLVRMLVGVPEKPRQFPKLVEVPAEIMQRYVGQYQLAPGAVFTVTREDNKLLVGLTGQSTFRVFPRSETEWFYKVVDATLTFHLDKNGQCDSVVLFQNGIRQTAKRISSAD
ncbi:serine hydrolase [Bremerella cremea]|nr:serine hydrolase [Bremerella cremea]